MFAGQAHFTSRLTPSLAALVEGMTSNTHRAFWFLHLIFAQLKHTLGVLDLVAAALLWRKTTRKIRLAVAIVGFGGGSNDEWFSGKDLEQVGAFLGLAALEYLAAPSS